MGGGGELQDSVISPARPNATAGRGFSSSGGCYVAIAFKAAKEAYHGTVASKEDGICR